MTEVVGTPAGTVMEYDITLVAGDGQESTMVCDDQTTIPAAAEEAGLVLKSSCQAGGCGACSAVLRGGLVEMGDPRPGRDRGARGRGWNPVVPQLSRGSCRIELPTAATRSSALPPTRHDAEITGLGRWPRASCTLSSRCAREDGSSSADFESGQFVRMMVPGNDPPARRAIRRPTWPTGTVSWSSTSGCCPGRHVGVPERSRRPWRYAL